MSDRSIITSWICPMWRIIKAALSPRTSTRFLSFWGAISLLLELLSRRAPASRSPGSCRPDGGGRKRGWARSSVHHLNVPDLAAYDGIRNPQGDISVHISPCPGLEIGRDL